MFDLIRDKRFNALLIFLISYRFIMQQLITPILLYLGKILMKHYQVQFMTTEKIIYLLSKPSVWLLIILGLGILLFLLSFELSSVVVLSEYENAENSLVPISLSKLKWTLKIKNLIYLPILMIVLLGFHFGMTSIITDQFFIPEFIYDTIIKTPSYLLIYTLIIILDFIVAFHLVFLFHHLFIGQKNFKEASKSSLKMVSGNRIDFVLSALKVTLEVIVASITFYFSSLFISSFLIYLLPPFFKINGVSLSIIFVINKILVFLVLSAISAINVLFITKKYHEYGGIRSEKEALSGNEKKTKTKYILWSLMFVTLTVQAYGAYQTTMTFKQPDYLEQRTYVTLHRGDSSHAPENTLAAIKSAKDKRADAAEIDVQLSKDGHVVVIHDFNLSRLANDSRQVVHLTLKELKELEVGSWFSEEFTGEKIPTLEEVIEEASTAIKLNIELKPTNDEAELAKAVIDILDRNEYNDRVIISSLNKKALKEVNKINPDLEVGYIVPVALGQFEFEEAIDFYSLEMSFLTKDLVEKIKNQEKEVHAWTVNSEEDLKRMQKLQVDNVITDNPTLAKKVLASNTLEKGILEVLSFLEF